MVEYEVLYNDVKEILSEDRFKHSEGVVKRAIEYAEIYGVDIEKVKLTAIAHDIAKEIPKNEILKTAEKYNVELDEIEKLNLKLPHGKIGAAIVKEKYGFTDDMVDAIKYHSTGKENMSMLGKIIYLADATEPGRTYFDLDWYVNIIKENIDRGMYEVSKWAIGNITKRDILMNLETVKCYNYYHQKIQI